MQNRLNDLVEAAGYIPIDPESPIDPAFDLAWFVEQTLFVVEVKSCTQDNQTQQLRLGIGQVLDYEDTLLAAATPSNRSCTWRSSPPTCAGAA